LIICTCSTQQWFKLFQENGFICKFLLVINSNSLYYCTIKCSLSFSVISMHLLYLIPWLFCSICSVTVLVERELVSHTVWMSHAVLAWCGRCTMPKKLCMTYYSHWQQGITTHYEVLVFICNSRCKLHFC
jgi:hypothetical protein